MPSPSVGSPPFSLSSDEWINLAKHLALAIVGVIGTFLTGEFLTTLKDHAANDVGFMIVALLSAGIPFVINAAIKLFADTRPNKLMLLSALTLGTLAFSGGVASAGDTAVIVQAIPNGALLIEFDAAGKVKLVSPLDQVVRVSPNPTPLPPLPPGPLTDRAIQIRDAAAKVTGDANRAATAKGLAELYRRIQSLGVTDPAVLQAALTLGADKLLNDPEFLRVHGPMAPAAWRPVRDVFSDQWNTLASRQLTDPSKPAPTLQDFLALVGEVASGLDASAPGLAISPELMQIILQVIQLLIQMFLHPPVPVPM